MVPKLTEVFVITEANVLSLAQRHNVPVEFATVVNDWARGQADAILTVFMHRNRYAKDYDADKLKAMFERDVSEGGWMRVLVSRLKKFPKEKNELVQLATTDWREFLRRLRKIVDAERAGKKVLELDGGFTWFQLDTREACNREGEMMHHCGEATGDMYSLRDQNDKPHVTADVTDFKPRYLMQCRGKLNTAPKEEYWPMVLELLKHLDATPSSEPYQPSEDKLWRWLKSNLRQTRSGS